MANSMSRFVWHDLMTTDVDAAARFYAAVIGWKSEDSGMPGPPYLMLKAGDDTVAGIMAIPPGDEGMPPCWTGYVSVADVDDFAARVAASGGKVWKQPADIEGVGRFAVVADPHGAVFILFRGNSPQGPAERPMDTPGHFAWNELMAGNGDEAAAWYAGLFGWDEDEAHDMGGFTYRTLRTGGATSSVGMMTKMPDMPIANWSYYTWVDGIDAAAGRVTANGGAVLMGPHEVPGGAWIANCRDPQGAFFSLIGTKG
ncbi:MAG: VOC family protein [Rhizobiaceae bacterium]